MDVRLVHPFTALVAGPTGVGKSEWVGNLIRQCQDLTTLPPRRVVWCYKQWQPLYDTLGRETSVEIEFVDDMDQIDTILDTYAPDHPQWLIFDDLMDSTHNKRIADWFTTKSHHTNVSVVHIVQNLFHQSKEQRTISLNSHYIILFRSVRDASQIHYIGRQMFPGNATFLTTAFADATRSPYRPLFLDLKSPNNLLRVRTNVLREDGGHPLVYLPIV